MATPVTMIQVVLTHDLGDNGVERVTTWVDNDRRLKEGVQLTLKDDSRIWTVEAIYYNLTLTRTEVEINRGWTNNI